MKAGRIRFRGPLHTLSDADRAQLLERAPATDDMVRTTSEAIIDVVRRDGDTALISLAREYDKVRLTSLEVPRDAWTDALRSLDPSLRAAMERAAANIRAVHAAALPRRVEIAPEPGIIVGRRPDPLHRIGVYAPGGRAAYPSSVLMGVIPARVAGVAEVIICAPPTSKGQPETATLAAAELSGADRVFAVGGAGAIAAMAYGTASIPRVDRIVGPGNAYVAQAKLLVSNVVGIDCPAGPSELLIVADDSADPTHLAAELLAQAEHDPEAVVALVTTDETLGTKVVDAIEKFLPVQGRRAIIEQAFAERGAILTAPSLREAIAFANLFAPEHLLLATRDADALLGDIRSAGTVFVGETSSVTFGDYITGANHVLPTGGLARSYSGLSTADFVRWTTYQRVDRDAAARLAQDVAAFAEAEHLPAHAAAARARRQYT
ncbi:MAG TPA: histidinol dehydrogenase [Gemmatimonadaceae bacterium]|jgi:histidinol dehydrogenase|nr:histidinol dehydrogenase [Gemmatimonadaceae bacterium]